MEYDLIFWGSILCAIIISFFLVRRFKGGLFHKILGGVVATVAFATIFYYLVTVIILFIGFFQNGV
jgi:hypothetical protein